MIKIITNSCYSKKKTYFVSLIIFYYFVSSKFILL